MSYTLKTRKINRQTTLLILCLIFKLDLNDFTNNLVWIIPIIISHLVRKSRNSQLESFIITFDRPIDVITVDAFYNCAELKSVQLPQTVMAIEETAFGQCTSLSSIKLSNELRNIGPQAFSGCTALVSITIPDSVEQIEQRTFCDCTALKSVTFGATSRDASSSNLRIQDVNIIMI